MSRDTRQRTNQFGETVEGDDRPMTAQDWTEKWETGQTGFHMPCVHPMLQKHLNLINQGRRDLSIFMPMCGKSLDLKWLADIGHVVIGNEVAELGCRQFFEENDLDYVISDIKGIPGKVVRSTECDVDISLYCCDFFKLTPDITGPIDAIWDRGSMAAMHAQDRQRYVQTVTGLMKPSTQYLLDTFRVDHDKFAGPPHTFPLDELKALFSPTCTIQSVDEGDCMNDWKKEFGIKYFTEDVHLLKLK